MLVTEACRISYWGNLDYDRNAVYDYFAMIHFLEIHANVFLLSVILTRNSLPAIILETESFECLENNLE